jgi:tetratricopeptide (TPR) repeat protein
VITNSHFILRLDPHEARLYGQEVLNLLEEARTTLDPKYGFQTPAPVTVEVFTDPNDFGVRTFGMPENPGYLGVCFGKVITANSPSQQKATPSNWRAVLWHEFCHVVTLQLTGNKIPRWLSEGISVFEETQRDPSWGQHFTPKYREMVLTKLTPVSKLSSAFLTAKDNDDLQFAYFQSYLVVRFIVEKFGMKDLLAILKDLNDAKEINDALAAHTLPIKELDESFQEHVEALAKNFGKGLKFEKEKVDVATLEKQGFKPDEENYHMLLEMAQSAFDKKDWATSEKYLKKIIADGREVLGTEEVFSMLAQVYENTDRFDEARKVFESWVALDGAAYEPAWYLAQSARKKNELDLWESSLNRVESINPFSPDLFRSKAALYQKKKDPEKATAALDKLLLLTPPDVARVHYQMAQLLETSDSPRAKKHLLLALEEAPRLREGFDLLRKLSAQSNASAEPETQNPQPAPAVP